VIVRAARFGRIETPEDAEVMVMARDALDAVSAGVLESLVATQHDSLYAFDADSSPCTTLWHANLIDATHGGTAGEKSASSSAYNGAIEPEIGVTGTPVVDLGTKLLYVVSKSTNSAGNSYY
jgi:hypothetical protein